MLYEGFKSKVICGQNLTEEFDIKTGVKQGCILSPFLFCLAIDWNMKRTDIGVKSGIIRTFTESLGDLDFADDISLLAHSHRDIQSKTEKLVRNAAKVGLHVNKDKTKTMRNNCQTADPVKLGEQDIEESEMNQNQKCFYSILTKSIYKVTMKRFWIRGPLLRPAWSLT